MKKLSVLLSALLFAGCVVLSGCANDSGADTKANQTQDSDTNTEITSADNSENIGDVQDETTVDTEVTVPEVPKFINKLTGTETTEELVNIRPVAIMINNLKVALPQQGISGADIMYEVLAEGGITRLLCLFTDYATLPETGSVRSSRDYYIDLSDAHDAIYVHCGTSPQATQVLKARKTDNMDGIYFNTPFYRNNERWKKMGQEHSMMTTGERLVKGIEEKGYRTTSDAKQPLNFNTADTPLETGLSAEYVKLVFSYYQTVELEYDAENGIYMKKQYGEPHIDSNNNEQLSFENAVVLYCNQGIIKGDTAGRLHVDFYGDGEGYYISNGEYKNIKWHKNDRTTPYVLYEEDGVTELVLNPGKTYIAVAPLGAETVIE